MVKIAKAIQIIQRNEPDFIFDENNEIDFKLLSDDTLHILNQFVNGSLVEQPTTVATGDLIDLTEPSPSTPLMTDRTKMDNLSDVFDGLDLSNSFSSLLRDVSFNGMRISGFDLNDALDSLCLDDNINGAVGGLSVGNDDRSSASGIDWSKEYKTLFGTSQVEQNDSDIDLSMEYKRLFQSTVSEPNVNRDNVRRKLKFD